MKKFDWKNKKIIAALIGSLIFISILIYNVVAPKIKEITYTDFKRMVESKEIQEVELSESSNITLIDIEGNKYKTDNPRKSDFKEFLLENEIKVSEKNSNIILDIISIITFLIYLAVPMSIIIYFPKNKNKYKYENDENVDIKFDDIAGNIEAKRELQDLVYFIKNAKEYSEKGIKLPKGAVLYGPPGTGKTLLAKAVAGESEVPFYYANGSEFVELFAGMGARKIRKLFNQARNNSPCVIFIDEIDAIGGARGSGGSSGDSEREQTINALLTELSGFNSDDEVVVIAATNRLEYLDKALIRSGRFGKKIAVELPSTKEREEIIDYYLKGKTLDESVDKVSLAKLTIGFSGADIEELINESHLIALREGRDIISLKEIDKAHYKIITQAHEKEDRSDISQSDLKIIAYHEAGHALTSKLLTNESIPKVTVIPTTSGLGGITFITPDKMNLHSKRDLLNSIKVLYGGRVGEYILLKDEELITTGASNDIKQATTKILDMIEHYGMSKYGLLDLSQIGISSSNEILEEATKLSKDLYKETLELLEKNKKCLVAIANRLIENDTLYEKELDKIINEYIK